VIAIAQAKAAVAEVISIAEALPQQQRHLNYKECLKLSGYLRNLRIIGLISQKFVSNITAGCT